MKLKVYKIYYYFSDDETCRAIAFTKEQAEAYCKYANINWDEKGGEDNWFYIEEEMDTDKVFECY